MRPGRRAILPVAVACFFLSGVAGLLYEVVWTRLLGLVFGHTVHAITTVLAAYMGGLALGSVLIGRRADRVARPLRLYGLLEAAIGLYCLATPLLFQAADRVYLWAFQALQPSPAGSTVLHLLLSAALLLPPTTLMGATLPVLSRAVVGSEGVAASQVGTLYAVNTWGAVLGTALTGFSLIPALGLRTTIWTGAALNLLVAAMALLLAPAAARRAEPAGQEEVRGGGEREAPALAPGRIALALIAIGISGGASMAYQVAWTRALSLALGSSTYAFTAMLTTFLVGLALGALVVSRSLRLRARTGLAAFALVELAAALAVVLMLPVLGRLPNALVLVLRWAGLTHASMVATQFGLSFAVMILPTLLIGATFPLLLAGLSRDRQRLGRDVGLVYGANTVGTILGSILAGFVLIRAIGIQNTILAAAAANLAVGLMVLVASPEAGRRVRALGVAAALGFVLLAVTVPRWDRNLMTAGAAVYAGILVQGSGDGLRELTEKRELLFYDEGISTTVSVTRDAGSTSLTVNGKVDAGNDVDMATQLLLGHLGPVLHPEARRALVIGFASGVTAGALAQHPLEAIDVAELEPAMREASSFFARENRNVLADPRVRLREGDGRSILATAPQPYDLIVSEPSNPWIAGVASLFTLEFYRAARERLAPGGVMVQWLQNYSMFSRDMQMVVRTFQEVFPHVSVWAASPNDYLLVATPEPMTLDLAAVEARLAASPGAREDFDRFGWRREGLVFRFFMGEEDARRYAAGAPFNTDDRPLLEFSAPLAMHSSSAEGNEQLMRSFRTAERPPVTHLDPGLYTGDSGHLRAARANWRSGHHREAEHQLSRVSTPEALSPELRGEHGRLLFLLGEYDSARAELEAVARSRPDDPIVRRYLRAATVALTPGVAQALAAASEPLDGVVADTFLRLARERRDPDFYEIVLEQMNAQRTTGPGSYLVANNHAGVLFELGRYAEAAEELQRAVELNPSLASTRFNLGLALEKIGLPQEALRQHAEAVRLAPDWANPRNRVTALQEELRRSSSSPAAGR